MTARSRTPGLGDWIERRAAIAPSDTALVWGEERRTYLDFATRVRATAALLHRLGVGPGGRVAFHGWNEPVALDTLYAMALLGAVWVPIHPARPEDEVRVILEDAEVSVLVRGREDDSECSPGERGEIVIRGPNVTAGHWRRPDATSAATLPGGWFRTGDVGAIDQDGFVTLVDRVRDAIELGNTRVYPAELERALYRAPGIADAAAVALQGDW